MLRNQFQAAASLVRSTCGRAKRVQSACASGSLPARRVLTAPSQSMSFPGANCSSAMAFLQVGRGDCSAAGAAAGEMERHDDGYDPRGAIPAAPARPRGSGGGGELFEAAPAPNAGVAKLADAAGLNPAGEEPWGFESLTRQQCRDGAIAAREPHKLEIARGGSGPCNQMVACGVVGTRGGVTEPAPRLCPELVLRHTAGSNPARDHLIEATPCAAETAVRPARVSGARGATPTAPRANSAAGAVGNFPTPRPPAVPAQFMAEVE